MIEALRKRYWHAIGALVLVGMIIAFFTSSMIGAISFAASVTASAAHLWSLKLLLGLGAKTFAHPDARLRPTLGAVFVVAASLATLPILIFAGVTVQQQFAAGLPCFLWGIGLVYSSLIGWAIIQR